jgi:hypothetical protein
MDLMIPFTVAMAALIALKLRSFKLWDELVEGLHAQHRAGWDALGQPIGYFWRPEDPPVPTVPGVRARGRAMAALREAAPAWLPEGDPLHVKIVSWRLTSWLSLVGFVVVLAATLLLNTVA